MGELNGPQLSLVVAEPGATRESVVAAMTASAEQINYEVILRPGRILTLRQFPAVEERDQGDGSSIEMTEQFGFCGRRVAGSVGVEEGDMLVV